ncbi:MAG: hypothetical protein IPI58_04425 [Alphaproteobacteria bacterium]|nr:MAG: hypothetical protein IPI58_04425 [Alphaproteobacteria bacterium]
MDHTDLSGRIRRDLEQGLEQVDARLCAGTETARKACRMRSDQIDAALVTLLDSFPPPFPASVMLIGGSGRRESFPNSDVDIHILHDENLDLQDAGTQEWFILFSDALRKAGLQIEGGHIGTCLRLPTDFRESIAQEHARTGKPTILTSLFSHRHIWGLESLYDSFSGDFKAYMAKDMDRVFLRDSLMRQMNKRHSATPMLFDPGPWGGENDMALAHMHARVFVTESVDIKEGLGGLRDLQTIDWLACAYGHPTHGRGDTRPGLLTTEEAKELDTAHEATAALRWHIHQVNNALPAPPVAKDRDKLPDIHYALVARRMGIAPDDWREMPAGRVWLHRSLRQRNANIRLLQIFMGALQGTAGAQRVNKDHMSASPSIVVDHPHYISSPLDSLLLTALSVQMDKGTPAIARMHRLHRLARQFLAQNDHVPSTKNTNALMRLIVDGHDIRGLALLSYLGVLPRLMDYEDSVLMPPRQAWQNTVEDQHGLLTLDVLRHMHTPHRQLPCRHDREEITPIHDALAIPEDPIFTGLAGGLSKEHWQSLCVAALLHDINSARGGDHALQGAPRGRDLLDKLKLLEPSQRHDVAFLIEFHQSMSRYADRHDPCDPKDVQRYFIRPMNLGHNPHLLTMLLLLTVADTKAATSGPSMGLPRTLSSVRAAQLLALYQSAMRLCTGQPDERLAVMRESNFDPRRQMKDISQILCEDGWEAGRIQGLVHRLERTRPSILHDIRADELAQLAQMLDQPDAQNVVVRIGPDDPASPTLRLAILGPKDRPGLLARQADVLASLGLSIVSASINHLDGMACNIYQVAAFDPGSLNIMRPRDPDKLQKIQPLLESSLRADSFEAARATLPQVPTTFGLSRALAHRDLPPDVRRLMTHKTDGSASIRLRVSGADRPRLLSDIAKRIESHGFNIAHALIITQGPMVRNTFVIGNTQTIAPDLHALDHLTRSLEELLHGTPCAPERPAESQANSTASTRPVVTRPCPAP